MRTALDIMVGCIFVAGLRSVALWCFYACKLLFTDRGGDSGRMGHLDDNERIR